MGQKSHVVHTAVYMQYKTHYSTCSISPSERCVSAVNAVSKYHSLSALYIQILSSTFIFLGKLLIEKRNTVMLEKSASILIVLIVCAVFPSHYFGVH